MKIPHNSKRWSFHTNRHRTTNGNAWGWIDGPAGNVCWSNDFGSKLTELEARAAVDAHNEWLNAQRSIEVRVMEATEKRDSILAEIRKKENELAGLNALLGLSDALIAELNKEET